VRIYLPCTPGFPPRVAFLDATAAWSFVAPEIPMANPL
jgi:hypothetical protein